MEKLETDFLLYVPKSIFLGYETRGRIEIEDRVPIRAKINSNEITGHHIPFDKLTKCFLLNGQNLPLSLSE